MMSSLDPALDLDTRPSGRLDLPNDLTDMHGFLPPTISMQCISHFVPSHHHGKFQFTLGRILGQLPFVRNFYRTQLIPKPSCGAPTFTCQLSSLSSSENNCIQFILPLRVVATCKSQRRFLPTWSQRFCVLKSGPN